MSTTARQETGAGRETGFQRVLLKLSGEALMGDRDYGIDVGVVRKLAGEIAEVAEPYIRRRAIRHLEKERIVIFAAGTGNPFFTTDTAAALRALEIHADVILMAKHGVEGVFDADPSEVPDAKFIPEITHRQAIERGLRVMDSTALSLCMDNDLPICVFNLADERNIDRIVSGQRVGTIVSSNGRLEREAIAHEERVPG